MDEPASSGRVDVVFLLILPVAFERMHESVSVVDVPQAFGMVR